jgi:hypothetical protein
LLLPLLVAAPAGRIVNVVSEFYGRTPDLGNLQGQRMYSHFGAYRAAKLGEVLFATELAPHQRLGRDRSVGQPRSRQDELRHAAGRAGRDAAHPDVQAAGQAAEGIAWAATAPELAGHSGALYMRGKQLSLKGAANDPSLAARVWSISEQQTEVDPARSVGASAGRPAD